jgi:L-ribulose-5-phosphate 3-epimerase
VNEHPLSARLAVCSWSLQPSSPQELITAIEATGVRRVQLALDPLRESPGTWGSTQDLFKAAGIEIVSGMFVTVGEDYTTMETIKVTGGIAPDGTWEENRRNIQALVPIAQQLGLTLLTFHAGFLPHDESDPAYGTLMQRLREVADIFGAAGITLGLETGQETAPALRELLETLDRGNVGVNFDPANMVLYDKGDPIDAVRTLAPWIRQVHIKDGIRTKVPGTWGEEVVAGTGDVDWPVFFATLEEIGYEGDLCIEREAGTQRVADIAAARVMVEGIQA